MVGNGRLLWALMVDCGPDLVGYGFTMVDHLRLPVVDGG